MKSEQACVHSPARLMTSTGRPQWSHEGAMALRLAVSLAGPEIPTKAIIHPADAFAAWLVQEAEAGASSTRRTPRVLPMSLSGFCGGDPWHLIVGQSTQAC